MSSDGATLSVCRYPGDGEPIVLLHGGPGMGDYMDSLAGLLSPHSFVVTYDQRGCGASTCDGSFAIDAQIADLDRS